MLPAAVLPGPSPSFLDVLERVEDPWQRRGVRHRLSSILLISVSAVLAGARSDAAIADWAKDIDEPTRAGFGLGGVLSHALTIRRLLQALNPAALEAALSVWVRSYRDALAAAAPPGPVRKRRTVLAVDGKTLRGAHSGDGQPAKLVAVYDHAHQLVLTQVRVEGGDEIAAFTAALHTLPDLHGYLHHRGRAAHPARARHLPALPWGALPAHRQGQPAHPAPPHRRAALGPGAPHAGAAARSRTRRVPHLSGPHPAPRPSSTPCSPARSRSSRSCGDAAASAAAHPARRRST